MLPSVHGKIGVDFLLCGLHIKYWSDVGGGLEYESFYRTISTPKFTTRTSKNGKAPRQQSLSYTGKFRPHFSESVPSIRKYL